MKLKSFILLVLYLSRNINSKNVRVVLVCGDVRGTVAVIKDGGGGGWRGKGGAIAPTRTCTSGT